MAIRLTVGRQILFSQKRPQLGALVLGVLLSLFSAQAMADTTLAYRVKAAFLYNFSNFVEWPSERFSGSIKTLDFCVFGEDPFGAVLDQTLRGKKINGRPLTVRRLNQPVDARDCLLVFFGKTDPGSLQDSLRQLSDAAVLTVSDEPRFLERGGMIRFLIVDGKVRFEINQAVVEQSGLKMSSKLLQVAHKVTGGPGGRNERSR